MQINTWIDADKALLEIGRIDRDIAAEEIAMNDAIEQTKRTSEEKVLPLRTQRKLAETRLLDFIKGNFKELGTARSRVLTYGTVGVKDYPAEIQFLRGQEENSIATLLIKKGYDQCVQVKRKVIKNAVKGLDLTEEALLKLGMKLKQKKNQPFYQVDEDRIAKEK
jgi:phage host-nuclease inhibitor protein Gam